MTNDRIKKACSIIDYAIKNNMSLKKASTKFGYSGSYVKNVRLNLGENIEVNDSPAEDFFKKYKEYIDTKKISTPDLAKPLTTKAQKSSDKFTVDSTDNEKTVDWTGSNYPADHIKTLDQLLLQAKVDTRIWKVKNYAVNKWDVTLFNKEKGGPETIQNFQVKATLEKNVAEARNVLASEVFKDMLATYKVPEFDFKPIDNKSIPISNLFEICLFDPHIGKLAWAGETGENYDVKIATDRFIRAINKLLQQALAFEYDRILFPIGNDFFNSDNLENTTTHGTPQDEDLRWQKTFSLGVKLLVDSINILKQQGVPIDVLIIPGNHDFQRSYFMGEYLSAWFANDKQVNINNGATPRKYYRFGKVLLGFTHGSEEKEATLPMLMATDIESKPNWSETVFHEWHLGHKHRKKSYNYNVNRDTMINEELGVTVRFLSSLTGTEEWHHKKGFVGSQKAAEAFIWNYNDGMLAHLNANIND